MTKRDLTATRLAAFAMIAARSKDPVARDFARLAQLCVEDAKRPEPIEHVTEKTDVWDWKRDEWITASEYARRFPKA
jgi:hypothetical protein